MRWVRILGGVLIVLGVVWILQGIGMLPGSFMSGRSIYAVLGLVVAVIGGLLLGSTTRR